MTGTIKHRGPAGDAQRSGAPATREGPGWTGPARANRGEEVEMPIAVKLPPGNNMERESNIDIVIGFRNALLISFALWLLLFVLVYLVMF